MPITNVLATMAVADHEAALGWYERLFGRAADRMPMAGLAEWQLTASGAIQVFRDRDRAGNGQLTLAVNDLGAEVAAMAARGIAGGPISGGDTVRFVTILDPEGNAITFAGPGGAVS